MLPSTADFARRLTGDLRVAVTKAHEALAKSRGAGKARADEGYVWNLSAMVNLYARTGEEPFLAWAKEDLLGLVKSALDHAGEPTPFLTHFRTLPPFLDAYVFLKARGAFSAAEIRQVDAQIAASVATHYDYADFGPQNRGLIDGVAFLYAANAVPSAPDVERWRRYGEALVADSENHWSIEDASIYEPFWLTYTLVLAELQNRVGEHMKAITTRFHFDYTKALLMPDGLLPDWGDGDWTLNWTWSVANLVRAGSYEHDGEYLTTAYRLYEGNMAYYKQLDADSVYCIGLALRWLDTAIPLQSFALEKSAEVIDDLVSKKIVFRSTHGDYGMINYRDEGPYARYSRDYLNAELDAYQEKPHHGHADENSFALLMADSTVLLADGGYRTTYDHGWRADFYHNRVVARTGRALPGDVFDYIKQDVAYHEVQTEKIHFGNFGSLDYLRTRLVDAERGYTGDRIVLFAPESSLYLVVDSIMIDVAGPKIFCNTWYPDNIIQAGEDYVVSWPEKIAIRKEYWPNEHRKELLIQFIDNRYKVIRTKEIERRYNPSKAFFQYVQNYFFKGQRLTFVTVLRPLAPGSFCREILGDVTVIKNEYDDNRTLGLRFSLNGEPVTVGLKLDQTIGLTNLRGRPMFDFRTGAVSYGDLRTDADFSFVRQRSDGSKEVGFVYGSALEFAGQTLFDMPLNHDMYQGIDDFRLPEIKDKIPRDHFIVPCNPAK